MILKNAVLFLIVSLGLLTSGCTTYYYSTVQSYEKELLRNQDGSFRTSRNDLSVNYSFKDLGGKVVYEIHNESEDPVFVDWSRSVIIAEDYAVQLRDNNARFHGDVSTTTFHFSNTNYSASSGSISGRVVLPQSDLFVPPHSKVVYSPMALSRILNLDIPAYLYRKRDIGLSSVRFINFTEEDTPLKFRSYLTIVNDRDKSQTVFEDVFFISEIIKTGSKNDLLSRDVQQRGDIFYIEIVNRNAVTAGWIVAGAAAVGGLILLAPHMPVEEPSTPAF
ncbi:hypothetical protein [Proteiniphilum sp. X52]|uniref:hypothetical protein n=1 Tax=Proteiniphilum sp. X52 TaxID=2382159 RepID=UPI000F09BB8D|nr:hypothetical protein [Proteiniphilum sp. X52]RNC64682.1 hypothetical protein D7D25_10080 [Proteiniphilum sp. X52]